MPEAPSGTVTFLFTDIEGSTRLWENFPATMGAALACHDQLLRQAIEAHRGFVFKTMGDAFCAAFATAAEALEAALQAQYALSNYSWGEIGVIKVRMALHTGAAESRQTENGYDYFGPSLNRVARLLSAGHGGQVLLSFATQVLVADSLPELTDLRDLGERRLKDLNRPEHIFQLVVPDLPSDFPPLRTQSERPTNLPTPPTSFVGREKEVSEVCELLRRSQVRLVTLLGPGGTGKTRLSLQVGARLLDEFEDGVFFVPLETISDPELVASAIAQSLPIPEGNGAAPLTRLQNFLRGKQILLVLDNFEQVVEAAPLITQLLRGSARLKVLVSSRIVLSVYGEYEYNVVPLSLPDLQNLPPTRTLSQYAAVALFVQRAQAVQPDFNVNNQNAPAVAEICARLDGLPLAIELAAARVRTFPPEVMLGQLSGALGIQLSLLSSGMRDLPTRQKTLWGAIEWGYSLLEPAERRLFSRLAVFVGGCTEMAALEICGENARDQGSEVRGQEDGRDQGSGRGRRGTGDLIQNPLSPNGGKSKIQNFAVPDLLSSLIDKSFLRREIGPSGEQRYLMLETIRAFAVEKLLAGGERDQLRERHAHYFLKLAEEAEIKLDGPEQNFWFNRLEEEHSNLRAGLAWTLETGQSEVGLRLSASLSWFWWLRGHSVEGSDWMDKILASYSLAPVAIRARTLLEAGVLARFQGAYERAIGFLEQSLVLQRSLADPVQLAVVLGNLGIVASHQGRYDDALLYQRECLELRRKIGDNNGIANTLNNLGIVAEAQTHYAEAASLYQQSQQLKTEVGESWGSAAALVNLGRVYYWQGDYRQALQLFQQSLTLFGQLGDRQEMAECLEGLAAVAVATGQAVFGLHLLGAAQTQREQAHNPPPIINRRLIEQTLSQAQVPLSDHHFREAQEAGRRLHLDHAVAQVENHAWNIADF